MKELREYGIDPVIADPQADADEAKRLYGLEFVDLKDIHNMDAVILAVAHREFAAFQQSDLDALYASGPKVLLDLKGLLDRAEYEQAGYRYWRL